MVLSPLQQYQLDIEHQGLLADEAQFLAMQRLEQCYTDLLTPQQTSGFWQRLTQRASVTSVKGVYLWGGVGRGKTYLVDTFFESVPFEQKRRLHYHRLMQQVHQQLRACAGMTDPMDHVAHHFSELARVLCIDEFFVSDITDAMLMAELLKGLFKRGVVLIATSNIVPEQLYRNGLQRARFLPAIDLIVQHCDVLNVDSGIDYRLRALTAAPCCYVPNDAVADQAMVKRFHDLAPQPGQADQQLHVLGRSIPCRWLADDVVLFEFRVLCQSARSQLDYIELAQCFHTVLVTNVMQMNDEQNDAARRFIALIDELYDRRVKLLLSAEVDLVHLYTGQQLSFEFKRCLSRLQEMQSEDYLSLAHRG